MRLWSAKRQLEPDGDPMGVAFGANAAAVGGNQLLDDCQADAGTSTSAGAAGVSPKEPLEDMRE